MWSIIVIIVVAFGLDFILGDPRSKLHPVALLGKLAAGVERLCRKLLGNSIAAGALGWLIVVVAAVVPVYLTSWAAMHWFNEITGAIVAGIWLYICIALKSLCQHADRIRKAMANSDIPQARLALSMIVSRDTANLGESEIVRGAVESLGENLVDAVNSAVFWAAVGFVIGGIPLAAALAVGLRVANTLDACWGYKNERYLYFGRVAARADDVLHFIPARLSLLTTALGATLLGGGFRETLLCGIKHRHDHPSPNSAWGMAAFAGALGIRLGGPTAYNGVTENNPYLGSGRADLNPADIRRAENLSILTALTFAFIMVLLAAVISSPA